MTLTPRSLVERLTRSLVIRRRLPPPFDAARLYVSPSAALGYAFKPMAAVDPTLFACADRLLRPGDTIWDVGANVGLFAAAAAVRAGTQGRVIAFEPDAWLVQLLRRSAATQPASSAPISVIPAAVGSAIALRSFAVARRGRASNAFTEYGSTQMGGVAQRQLVAAFNMDWLLTQLPAPDVIKIDVEGAELEALSGQTRMLEQVRPVIICEVSSTNRKALTQLLSEARYRLYNGDALSGSPQPVQAATWNTVAVPAEKPNRLEP